MNSAITNAVVPPNPDFNYGEIAIIEQDAPATPNPIEFDGIRILSTLQALP